MMDLKLWLGAQGLTVRELALQLEEPLKTAQEWAYRGVSPSGPNQDKLTEYVASHCAHHWVIPRSNGPESEGVPGVQWKQDVRNLRRASPPLEYGQ